MLWDSFYRTNLHCLLHQQQKQEAFEFMNGTLEEIENNFVLLQMNKLLPIPQGIEDFLYLNVGEFEFCGF